MRRGLSKNMLLPAFIGAAVLAIALSLVTIVARSPYTHSNLDTGFNPGYRRTEPMLVGAPVPVSGDPLALPRPSDQVALGKLLFVSDGCASCHGLDAHGGIVGPAIAGTKAGKLRAVTQVGPGGMPPYASGALTDEDLAAIAAYLDAMTKK